MNKNHLKQREILNDIAPDFARDGEMRYISKKRDAIVSFIGKYMEDSHAKGVVLGLSGGVDSYLVGALCALSCRESNKRLLLLSQPNREQQDYADVLLSEEFIREIYPAAEFHRLSIEHAYRGALKDLDSVGEAFSGGRYAKGNLQARLRMIFQYALANGMLVMGTDHATESVTGFYTKYGDGGVDVNPIGELLKDDIYAMAKDLGAPGAVIEKAPSAGLGISGTDEEELGIKYCDICSYLKGNLIGDEAGERLIGYYERTRHKRAMPATMKETPPMAGKRTIIVVDFVHAFIDGELACANAGEALKNSIEYINSRPAKSVLYARDRHPQNHCSFAERGGPWPAHAVDGTRSAAFHESLYTEILKTVNTPIERYNVFDKGRDEGTEQYSAADAVNEAYGTLRGNVAGDAVIVGAATEYCVLNTAMELLKDGRRVAVMESGLAYVDIKGHKKALDDMRSAGVKII